MDHGAGGDMHLQFPRLCSVMVQMSRGGQRQKLMAMNLIFFISFDSQETCSAKFLLCIGKPW